VPEEEEVSRLSNCSILSDIKERSRIIKPRTIIDFTIGKSILTEPRFSHMGEK
jgi:hypothetical protein